MGFDCPRDLLRLVLNITEVRDVLYTLLAPTEVYTLTKIANISLSNYEKLFLLNPMNEITRTIRIPPIYEPIVYSPFLPEAIERIRNPSMLHRGMTMHIRIAYIKKISMLSDDFEKIDTFYRFVPCYNITKFMVSKSIVCSAKSPMLTGDWIAENLKKVHKTWNTDFDKMYYMRADGKLHTFKQVSRWQYSWDDHIAIYTVHNFKESLYCIHYSTLDQ